MREITTVEKTKTKKIFQFTEDEFRLGDWCKDLEVIPDGPHVEMTYSSRNGIMVVHNLNEIKVKELDKGEKPEETQDDRQKD